MRACARPIYRSLFIQARGVLKEELMNRNPEERTMMSSSNSPHLGEAGPERARFLPAFPKPAAPTLPISEAWHTAKIRRLTSPNSRRDMILSAGFYGNNAGNLGKLATHRQRIGKRPTLCQAQ